jgi:hypothetical protein
LDLKDASTAVAEAKELLEQAKLLCRQQFQNGEALGNAVDEALRLLGKEWYEVTAEEIAAIKAAMVGGEAESLFTQATGTRMAILLQSANAECQWSLLGAQNAVHLLEEGATELLTV